jgi:hypothetical protein
MTSPIYAEFDTQGLQSTQMYDEISYFGYEDDRQWLQPTETDYPLIAQGKEKTGSSLQPINSAVNGIRLRPISDLRLLLKSILQAYNQLVFFSVCIQRNFQIR